MFVKFCGCAPAVFILLTICTVFLEAKTFVTRRNFATKSRYPFYSKSEDFGTPRNCKPLHINMVFRHGTRYPSTKDIEGMNKLEVDIERLFNKDDPVKYRELTLPWTNRFKNGPDKMLSRKGEEEMYNIAKRLLERFPTLFNRVYFGEKHHFVSTATPRTIRSASAFAFGLFEGKGHLGPSNFQPVSMVTTNLTEPVLRFFDVCPVYQEKVMENRKVPLMELHKFQRGPEMVQVKKAIADRLNVSGSFNITADHIRDMFLSCAYELAIYGEGEWCSIFEEDDLDIVEYLYDIKNYWKRGYGYEINYIMSCLLLKNLTGSVREVAKAVENSHPHTHTDDHTNDHTHAIFHFSHAETLIPLLCIMGLFNDTEPLLASNYDSQKNRLFKTSKMAPFSGNVAVVLYSCNENPKNQSVQVLVNEKVAALPCCGLKDLCPLQDFLACFGDIDQWCDFSKICSPAAGHNYCYYIITTIITISTLSLVCYFYCKH